MVGIYKIENLINNKVYIGQSVNIEKRWSAEKSAAKTPTDKAYNYPLSQAFRKYGIENFSFEILEECNQTELNEKEKYYIQKYNSYFKGYNQTFGGDTSSQAPKEKIIGIFNDLKTTNLLHREIAEKWQISQEMVQGINTGRYWYNETEDYPLQKNVKPEASKIKQKYFCLDCGKQISKHGDRCIECALKARYVVERPSREELKVLIRTMPFIKIGQKFGVSDNAIRRWCEAYKLPKKVSEIKKFSQEEWDKI